jgi:carboxyl-terminal processing protease
MTAKEAKVSEQMAGNRYVGIHVALGMDKEKKRPTMHDVFPNGPADRAGVKTGDLLEAVEGVDTKGMDLRAVIDRLRGDEGTDVTITVRQPKETKSRTMKMTRGQLPHSTIEGIRQRTPDDGDFRLDGPDPIGYVKIKEIGASTAHELRKLARRMEGDGLRALVIDLRGGQSRDDNVHPAVLLADALLESGAIGRLRTTRGETIYQADPDALFRGWPVVALVDNSTFGTSEWIAAALQDNHRAVLVGSPTQGAHRAPRTGGMRLEKGLPPFIETSMKSTVPVGDGRWWISLATGYLERGDGRPLVDRDANRIEELPGRNPPRSGVQPDHLIDQPRRREPADFAGEVARIAASKEDLARIAAGKDVSAATAAREELARLAFKEQTLRRQAPATRPGERAYAPVAKADTPPTPTTDPALQEAVKVLHKLMEKR